jgi:hypothetical protein
MAVVAVAEPHYMAQVRTLIRPNVTIDDSEGVLAHIHDILSTELPKENTDGFTETESE